jgi:hypothetical protein
MQAIADASLKGRFEFWLWRKLFYRLRKDREPLGPESFAMYRSFMARLWW